MYRLVVTKQAKSELKKIKITSRAPIQLALQEIKETPTLGKLLSRNLNRKYSHRVGVYRIIYQINEMDKIVTIISAGHRGVVYN